MKALCIVIVIAFGIQSWISYSNSKEDKNQIALLNNELKDRDQLIKVQNSQIQALNQQISELTTKLVVCNQENSNLKVSIREREVQIEDLTFNIENLEDKISSLVDSLNVLKTEKHSLQARLNRSVEFPAVEDKHRNDEDYALGKGSISFLPNPRFIKYFWYFLLMVASPFVVAFGVGLKEKVLRGKYRKF